MTRKPFGMFLEFLRAAVGAQASGDATDADLLTRFAAQRDEAAFTAILQRHGPLVLGICRRVLGNAADADDAFQATFLVLVRKAGSIRNSGSMASWLHGVAYRVALEARSRAWRRREQEQQAAIAAPPDPYGDVATRELREILDEELAQLPAKYRAPLVLHYFASKTKEETAQQLGWSEGTVSGRLARARDLLRGRLTRRGVSVSTAALAAALAQDAAAVTVASSLTSSTANLATLVAAGEVAVAANTARILALTETMVRGMLVTKLKVATAALLLAAVGLAGGGLIFWAQANQPAGAGRPGQAPANPAGGAKEARQVKNQKADALDGTWLMVKMEIQGKSLLEKDEPPTRFTIKDGKLTSAAKQAPKEALELAKVSDPTKKPKTVTLPLEGTVKFYGIYEVRGDELRVCGDAVDTAQEKDVEGRRPKEFDSNKGLLLVFKREHPDGLERSPAKKPGEQDKIPRAAAEERTEMELLQGIWLVVSSQVGDEKEPIESIKKKRVTVKGDKLTLEFGNERDEKREGTVKIDPKTRAFDWIIPVDGGATMKAIYDLDGDDLKIGFGNDGMIRPARWEINKDQVVWLLVLKREIPPPAPPADKTESLEKLIPELPKVEELLNGRYVSSIKQPTTLSGGFQFRYPYDGGGAMKTFFVDQADARYLWPPKVDAKTAEGRKAIFETLGDAIKGPHFTIDGKQLIVFNGARVVPFRFHDERLQKSWFDVIRRIPRELLVESVKRRHAVAKLAPGPIERSYVLPLGESSFFAALTGDDRPVILWITRTTEDFQYDVGHYLLDPAR